MKPQIKFSIIIPVRQENDFLKETLKHLRRQTYKQFEILVITDKISRVSDPSTKRNLGAKKAKGQYLAFLDDDSYPDQNWLQNIYHQILKHPDYAAFCGPCLTPPRDHWLCQSSGLYWSSYLGSGGAGSYRNLPSAARFVDDYPSVNLIVKKSDFLAVHGFQSKYWPGEDTILCLNLVSQLHQKIYYHPSIVVYHHRRRVLLPHLQQIKRYAQHRGLFARKFPQTSFRLGYLMPSLFFLYLVTLVFFHPSFYFFPLYLYLYFLLASFYFFLVSTSNFVLSLTTTIIIPITHLYYGILFLTGLFSFDLKFKPHRVNHQTGDYIGG